MNRRGVSYYLLSFLLAGLVVFLYAPTVTILILSFQGPNGGLTFPMNGASLHWFSELLQGNTGGDLFGALERSISLGMMVAILSTAIALAAAMYFRGRHRGSELLLSMTIMGLVVPSVLVGLGVGLVFGQLGFELDWYSSAFGAQLTWILPFGVLILLAVFNRFDRRWEEAARDLGASGWRTFLDVVLPIIGPGVIGVAILSFSLSYDEFTRTALTSGLSNTLPLEIASMTQRFTSPILYVLGSATTAFSFVMLAIGLTTIFANRRSRISPGRP